MKSITACARQRKRQRQRQGKEKVIIKDHKGMLITENYKNIRNGDGHGVSWEKPHESVHFKGMYISGDICEESPINMA
jgi:hypothetical protein